MTNADKDIKDSIKDEMDKKIPDQLDPETRNAVKGIVDDVSKFFGDGNLEFQKLEEMENVRQDQMKWIADQIRELKKGQEIILERLAYLVDSE